MWGEFGRAELRSFALFALFGVGTAVIYFGMLAVMLEVFAVEYKIAVSVSYVAGVMFHFLMNKLVTFKQHGLSGTHWQMAKYSVLVVINYLLTIFIVVITVENLGLPPYIGVVFSMGVTVITGYLLSRFWVFKKAS